MNGVGRLWQDLALDARGLLQNVQGCFEQQPLTLTWTEARRAGGVNLVSQMLASWDQRRVDLEALWALQQLTADLDLAGTVTCRAALETVQGHYRRIVEQTGEALDDS